MSLFGIYMRLCGLSRTTAAVFLGQKEETIKSQQQGRFRPRDAVMGELYDLRGRIEHEADAELDRLEAAGAPYDVSYAGDDDAAHAMGWPLAGPQNVVADLVVAGLPVDRVRVVTLRGADLVPSVEEMRASTDPRAAWSSAMRRRREDPAFLAKLQAASRAAATSARTEDVQDPLTQPLECP